MGGTWGISRVSRACGARPNVRARGRSRARGVPRALPRLGAISVPRWKQREQESEEHVARKRAVYATREHTDENRSIERNARVPTVRFFPRRKKPDGKPEAPLAGRKARGGCAPLVFSGVEGARSIRAEPKYRSEVRVPFASRGRRSAWAVGRVRLWRERCSGRRSLGLCFQTYALPVWNQSKCVMFLATRTSQLRRSMGRNGGVSRGKS